MSARVLNQAAMMSEMTRMASSASNSTKVIPSKYRISPNQAALAKVRRDLFGPVDHAATQALVDRELKAQAELDSKRWGFDFKMERPLKGTRYDWKLISDKDYVPEPYALRSMKCLTKRRSFYASKLTKPQCSLKLTPNKLSKIISETIIKEVVAPDCQISCTSTCEKTPPQQEIRSALESKSHSLANISKYSQNDESSSPKSKQSSPATQKQVPITEFLKNRKRPLSSKNKSIEPPLKISRNTNVLQR
ncbi:cyclin-dependent kinase inhibitor 1B-like [Trichogramma pretiosum]|uniref:cyclin-dependent kinase inhibitor 1B-like n=1 Tax=Trichogramma pretiosum TaxID=7493 RepID=UPI0006C9C1D8|nr:cyclin-dependent kinase inhibitor 1B-like [Trichogramma pretiosum]